MYVVEAGLVRRSGVLLAVYITTVARFLSRRRAFTYQMDDFLFLPYKENSAAEMTILFPLLGRC